MKYDRNFTFGRLLALPANISPGWKWLTLINVLAYLQYINNYSCLSPGSIGENALKTKQFKMRKSIKCVQGCLWFQKENYHFFQQNSNRFLKCFFFQLTFPRQKLKKVIQIWIQKNRKKQVRLFFITLNLFSSFKICLYYTNLKKIKKNHGIL